MQVREYCVHHAVGMGVAVYLGNAARCRNYEACGKQATFGYRGNHAIYCKACIPEDLKHKLINVKFTRCEVEGCDTQPSFGSLADRVSATAHHHNDSILCIVIN
jgi:hypothetical protein